MKRVAIGAHLRRDDVEPLAEAVAVGDLVLSAISIPDEQAVGERELLLRVAQIRGQLLERATFIAIRYGFTFSSDAEAFGKVAAQLPRWNAALEANRDNVEMTLKVVASSPRPRPDRKDFANGADYLRALHAATTAATIDPAFKAAVEEHVVPLTLAHRWNHRDEKSIELAALIARDKLDTLREAGETLRATTKVPFLLSAPWPLEVFADADRE